MKLEELEKLIDVENLAKEDAKKNLPVTDSEGPDSSESKIRLIIKGLLIDKIKDINKLSGNLETLLKQTKIKNEKRIEDTKTAPDKFSKEASRLVDRKFNQLNRAKKRLVKSEVDLRDYKVKNNLENTEPDFPESQVLNYALIVFGLAIETIINASVFAKFVNRGLIEGMLWAFGFASINIILAILFGIFAFRQLWNPSLPWKFLGGTLCLFWLFVLLIGGNLLIATFRENLDQLMNNQLILTWEVYKTSATQISHPGSWLLLSVGIIFGIIAFIKGFYSDDRHPGYGRRHRNVEKFTDLVEIIEEGMDKGLKKILGSYHMELKRNEMYVQSAKNSNLKTHQKRTRVIKDFNNFFDLSKSNIEYFVRKYREINSSERTDDPPKYFANKIEQLDIKFEKFKEYNLDDYQLGEKEIFNKIKSNIDKEYNNIHQVVVKKINAK